MTERVEPGRWSALEYAAHVRDLALGSRERIVAALADDVPDPGPLHSRFRVDSGLYADDTADLVIADLASATSLLVRLLRAVPAAGWGRPLICRWPRRAERSVAWVAAQVVHEYDHHCGDIGTNLARGRGPLCHLIERQQWERYRAGPVTDSSRGLTLDQVGFIHLCTPAQVDGVASRYYADVLSDLVVLEVDPAGFEPGALRFEVVGSEAYPHLYSALPAAAIRAVRGVG